LGVNYFIYLLNTHEGAMLTSTDNKNLRNLKTEKEKLSN